MQSLELTKDLFISAGYDKRFLGTNQNNWFKILYESFTYNSVYNILENSIWQLQFKNGSIKKYFLQKNDEWGIWLFIGLNSEEFSWEDLGDVINISLSKTQEELLS